MTELALTSPPLIGRYRLLQRLGLGGMGEVWEAEPRGALGPVVAIKTLLPQHRGDGTLARRVLDEARIGGALHHRNIVTLLDTGIDRGVPYLVMERLQGSALSAVCPLPGAPLDPGAVVAIGLQVLEGLAFAQQAPGPDGRPLAVVHRDIKPSNLFVTHDGIVKIIDFGLALASIKDATETARVRGSLGYCSPEQIRNDALDGRTDLFSLGLVLHSLLTGRRVFGQENEAAILGALLWGTIPPVRQRRPDVPAELDRVIGWALEKEREARPATAEAFAEALRAALPAHQIWGEERLGTFVTEQRQVSAKVSVTASFGSIVSAPQLRRLTPTFAPAVSVPVEPVRRSGRGRVLALAAIGLAAAIGGLARRQGESELRGERDRAARPTLREGSIAATGEARRAEGTISVGGTSGREMAGEVEGAPAPVPEVSAPSPERAPPSLAAPPSAFRSKSRIARRPAAVDRAPVAPGWLTIDARPRWATVRLDGRLLGPTPVYRERVAPGLHVIELVRDDGKRQRRTVRVAPDGETKAVLEF